MYRYRMIVNTVFTLSFDKFNSVKFRFSKLFNFAYQMFLQSRDKHSLNKVTHTPLFVFSGVERFANDVRSMIGFRPGIFWIVCWAGISPVFLLVRYF